MFDYKSVEFYNEFFKSLSDFTLKRDFSLKQHIYTGTISVNNAPYDVEIDVEIPEVFPHQKLYFTTKSLFGYPHLIESRGEKDGCWFCLNTPFAETPELQLNLEIGRLREWLKQNLRKDLPAFIDNDEIKFALQKEQALEWERPGEIQEFVGKRHLTFVGDFAKDPQKFKENGTLFCKIGENKYGQTDTFYVYEKKPDKAVELPYIIVEETINSEMLNSFFSLRQFYNWSEEEQEKLLPGFELQKKFCQEEFNIGSNWTEKGFNELQEQIKRISIEPEHRHLFEEVIENFKKNMADPPKFTRRGKMDEEEQMIQDMLEQQAEEEYNDYLYNLHYYAIGIRKQDSIQWILLWTNRNGKKYHTKEYVLKPDSVKAFTEKDGKKINVHIHGKKVIAKELVDLMQGWQVASYIDEKNYFGRGLLSGFSNKKIALIGVGAIGSICLEMLVRGGAKNIEIWDNDTLEPGNLCRSAFSNICIGHSKSVAAKKMAEDISPFCSIVAHDCDLYGDINYESQEDIIKKLDSFDIIFDCTASNELLHFLSYSITHQLLISMSITNHAQNLLVVTNKEGDVFELRKSLLGKIEQDTSNYYVEGTGCYSPTFFASGCDVSALVNIALRNVNIELSENHIPSSTVFTYDDRGVVAERYRRYSLPDKSISLIIGSETLYDGEELPNVIKGPIGYLLGSYSRDGKNIFLTHFVDPINAPSILTKTFNSSQGIIDYIGDFCYSRGNDDICAEGELKSLIAKAENIDINTNNPLLALRRTDGSISFYLYIESHLEPLLLYE